MLVDFIDGECKFKQIGREKGDIPEWDDCILEDLNSDFIHCQVKYQNTPFSIDNIERDKKRTGELKDLSVLDKAIFELGNWYTKTTEQLNRNKKRFRLYVPNLDIDIKAKLKLRVLHELCETQIQSTTTTIGLESLFIANQNFKNISLWLDSWCNISSKDNIIGIFGKMRVIATGSIEDINNRIENTLKRYFNNPATVRQQITDMMSLEANTTSDIDSLYLYTQLSTNLRKDKVRPWTKYSIDPTGWSISGIVNASWPEIQQPDQVISGAWSESEACDIYLRGPVADANPALINAISRLFLHLPGSTAAYTIHNNELTEKIKKNVGGTIGREVHEPIGNKIYKSENIGTTSISRTLDKISDQNREASDLDDQMLIVTWNFVKSKISIKISSCPVAIITRIETRWNNVRDMLENDHIRLNSLFKSMMRPSAERPSIRAELRIGISTASLIATAFFYQIFIIEALEAPMDTFEKINNLAIQAFALVTWSGPSDSITSRVRRLGEEGSVELLGREPSSITILPHVNETPTQLLNDTMADTSQVKINIATSHRPKVIITATPEFERLIRTGDLNGIKTYIETSLRNFSQISETL